MGAALARPGALCRLGRLSPGRLSARRLALPRLRGRDRSTSTSPTTASSPSSSPATSSTPTIPSCGWRPATSGWVPMNTTSANVAGQWDDILNDITDVTGEVFLGLSIGCAVPRPQVRPDPPGRLLPAAGVLRPAHAPRRSDAGAAARSGTTTGAAERPGRRRRPGSCTSWMPSPGRTVTGARPRRWPSSRTTSRRSWPSPRRSGRRWSGRSARWRTGRSRTSTRRSRRCSRAGTRPDGPSSRRS